jgi:hypothetical protein
LTKTRSPSKVRVARQQPKKETVVEQEIHITLGFSLATGEVNLNEIVYALKEVRDALMLRILEQVLVSYDDLISERLSHTEIYPSKARKGLGRHFRKGEGEEERRYCRGRKVKKRGYREKERKIATVVGGVFESGRWSVADAGRVMLLCSVR